MIVRELVTLLGYKEDKTSKKKAEQGFASINKKALAVSSAVVGIGLAAAAVFNKFVGDIAAAGDEIAKTSKQLGLNAQRLQELRFAANLAGTSNSEMTLGLRRLQAAAKEAGDGTQSYVDDFKTLGVTVRDSSGQLKSAEDLLFEVADGMNALENDTVRVALAQTLLGRSGTKMIPLLTLGSKGIKEQTARARELGEVMDAEVLQNSENLMDAQRELTGAFLGFKVMLAREFMPAVIESTKWMTDLVISIRGPFMRAFRAIETTIRATLRAMSEFLAAITGIEDALKIYAVVALAAWALSTAPILIVVAALALVSAALVAVIEDLEEMGTTGEGFFATIIKGFQDLVKEVGFAQAAIETLQTAIDALKPGLFEDIVEFFGGRIASEENRKAYRDLEERARQLGDVAPTAFAFPSQGGPAPQQGPVMINNNVETTVNAPAGMNPEQLAAETATRSSAAQGRLMRRTKAQLGVGG